LPPGDEGRPALGQELHGAELPEPRLVYACRARRDRPSARRLLIDVRGERRRSPRHPPPVTRSGPPRTFVARAKPALDQRLPKRLLTLSVPGGLCGAARPEAAVPHDRLAREPTRRREVE